MSQYCVNKNKDDKGNHEVHKMTCDHLPETRNQIQFYASSDSEAMKIAKVKVSNEAVDGCYHCMNYYHHG